jgi:hypothetical protein
MCAFTKEGFCEIFYFKEASIKVSIKVYEAYIGAQRKLPSTNEFF